MAEISLTPSPVQPLQTRHTPKDFPAPETFSAQFLFATFATIFDQMIKLVIVEKSKDYFQNNDYRVKTLENKVPTCQSLSEFCQSAQQKGGNLHSLKASLGTYTLLLKTKQQLYISSMSDKLKLPKDMKYSLSAIKLNTLSQAKVPSDCIWKVCTMCKTCSSFYMEVKYLSGTKASAQQRLWTCLVLPMIC